MALLLLHGIAVMALLLHGAAMMALLLRSAVVVWRYNDGATAEKKLFFFYSKALGEKMRARKRKRSEIRNLFPSSIG
jgi:hypothetical protein